MLRGSGRTAAQMESAKIEAVYVWCNNHLKYPRDLAKRLGRGDLHIVGPNALENKDYWAGRRPVAIITDHACNLTERQVDGLILARSRIRGDQNG